jgi:hypothetical protein
VNSASRIKSGPLIKYSTDKDNLELKKIMLIIMMVLLALSGCKGTEKEVIISKADLQKMIEVKFPIEKNFALVNINLYSPRVFFKDDSIGLALQYSTNLILTRISGSVSFKCKPVYRPGNTSFYMSNFEIIDITMDNAGGFIDKDRLMGFISMIINVLFDDTPLYTLNPSDYRQDMARMLLKSVIVRGDNLVLVLSL